MRSDAAGAIRDAFAAGEFARAERLFSEYAGGIEAAIRNRTARPAMLSEARDLIDWARLVGRSFRAQALERLKGARVAEAYSPAATRPAASIRVSF